MTPVEFNYKLLSLQKNLNYFAYTLTSNYEDAQDLVQETYLKALTNRDKFTDDTNLKAWAFTIMKNTFINNYRQAVRNNTILDKTDDLYFLNLSRESGEGQPDSSYHVKEIQKEIRSIDEEQRKPFEMYNNGYKYKEIAEKLNLSIGTVKSRIFFTRKKLMDSLSQD
ncbi:MAG TPA: RNA polymerase sigma factor [Bacteroidales bacterium]|jgi:RNA polymerase sigma-70 factor (ECF subfamily)|nr:RNA polymerase sigma factor [Bacteroidales bacterium]